MFRDNVLRVGVMLLVGLVLVSCNFPQATSVSPAALIVSPPPNRVLSVGERVQVEAIGVCSHGVSRIELWVDGALLGKADAPSEQPPQKFTMTFGWTPAEPGSHTLEARVFCVDGQHPAPFTLPVQVAQANANTSATPPADTPAATSVQRTEEATSTATPTQGAPYLVATADVNIRSGPGTNYPILGVLHQGEQAVITGRNADASWWQISFPPGTGGRGWVAALYTTPHNAAEVPVAQAPPPPPTATPTQTPVVVSVNFWADSTEINAGDCTTLHWSITGAQGAYLDGSAVGLTGTRQVCPSDETTYTLRAVKFDGGTVDKQVTVKVNIVAPPLPTLPPVIILYPDLKIRAYTISNYARCGNRWNVYISIVNDGTVAAPAFSVQWMLNGTVEREWTVNRLNVGGVWSVTFQHVYSCNQAVDITTQVSIDPANQVKESVETNNTATINLHITP